MPRLIDIIGLLIDLEQQEVPAGDGGGEGVDQQDPVRPLRQHPRRFQLLILRFSSNGNCSFKEMWQSHSYWLDFLYFWRFKKTPVNFSLAISNFVLVITINEPVGYMARAVMILMRGKDITGSIGRGGPWKSSLFWALKSHERTFKPMLLPWKQHSFKKLFKSNDNYTKTFDLCLKNFPSPRI